MVVKPKNEPLRISIGCPLSVIALAEKQKSIFSMCLAVPFLTDQRQLVLDGWLEEAGKKSSTYDFSIELNMAYSLGSSALVTYR